MLNFSIMAYKNTFITVAPDCPINQHEEPTSKRPKKPIHLIQFELIRDHPYHYDHYSLIFQTYLIRNEMEDLAEDEKKTLWEQLFSKGHPCLRASALTKRYGYGAHYNEEGKIALYPMESDSYNQYLEIEGIEKIPAMRSKR